MDTRRLERLNWRYRRAVLCGVFSMEKGEWRELLVVIVRDCLSWGMGIGALGLYLVLAKFIIPEAWVMRGLWWFWRLGALGTGALVLLGLSVQTYRAVRSTFERRHWRLWCGECAQGDEEIFLGAALEGRLPLPREWWLDFAQSPVQAVRLRAFRLLGCGLVRGGQEPEG